jgi:hypothetical protein
MTTTRLEWLLGFGADMHLVRGQTTGRLDELLGLVQSSGPAVLLSTAPRPADFVSARFIPHLNAAAAPVITAHGVSIDTTTGEVSALAAAPARPVRNFIVDCEVTITDAAAPGGQRTLPLASVRVHIHAARTRAWLTPNPLSIRQGSPGQRLSVLAQFNEGAVGPAEDTVCDITATRGITWAPGPAAVTVDAASGALTGNALSGPVAVSANLPARVGGGTAAGTVAVLAGWAAQPAATRAAALVDGPGRARMADVPNLLLLGEGFPACEGVLFQQVAEDAVRELRTSTATSPFNLLRDSINYWRVHVPSPQTGLSVLHDLGVQTRVTGPVGLEVPPPRRPDPAVGGDFELDELIHEVGLPIPADAAAAVTFATKSADWAALYNVNLGRVTAGVFDRWKALADRRRASERDTALGLAAGEPPAATLSIPNRYLGFHPLRSNRAQLDLFLATVTDGAGGPVIGTTWTQQPTAGKDRYLLFALCRGGRSGGGGDPDPADPQRMLLVTSSLVSTEDTLLAAVGGSREVNVAPHPVPTKPNGAVTTDRRVLARIAHETAHAYGLQEEYGGKGTITAADLNIARLGTNTQAADDVRPSPAPAVSGVLVKWRWPRLLLAGQLVGTLLAEGGGLYRARLVARHGATFAALTSPNNVVHLRGPLTNGAQNVKLSGPLEILEVLGDEVRLRDPASAVVAADYPALSVLCQPVPAPPSAAAAGDTHAELQSQVIRAHITLTGGPLNAPPPPGAQRPCAPLPDETGIQDATNVPAGLPVGRPRFRNWIVGLFEAGAGFDCGVYHPTGICNMRQLQVPTTDPRTGSPTPNAGTIYRFCVVCQYALVDRIDPRVHRELDRQVIGPEYPQP